MAITSFRDLLVWQEAMRLVEEVYRLSGEFPKEEQFGLTSQMRRAAVSIPSNIAEGARRRQLGAFLYHLRIALGSQAEIEVQLEIAMRLKLCSPENAGPLAQRNASIGRMLNGLITSVRSKPRST